MGLLNPLGTGPAGPTGATGSPGGGTDSWRRDIIPFMGWTSTQGTFTISQSSGVALGQIASAGPVAGDNLSFSIGLEAGTWEIDLMMVTFTNRGQVSVKLDGTQVMTYDGWSSAAVNNVVFTQGGIVVASGQHTLQLSVTGKNASATAFILDVQLITLRRTA